MVIMNLGGLIPMSTYICPSLCIILLNMVLRRCGKRMTLAWYGAVSILSLMMGPDKEAVAVFIFLGYYPIVKPMLDKTRLNWLWKVLLFNSSILIMYWLLINLFGMAQLAAEFQGLGTILLLVTLVLGNMVFFMLDKILGSELKLRR